MSNRIVHIPETPYYAVIAPSQLISDITEYANFGPHVIESAQDVDGFLGIEMGFQPEFSLAVSYWTDLDAINQWRHHPVHRQAKARGMNDWFTAYTTRIAQVIDQY